jgi:hypothetical protein
LVATTLTVVSCLHRHASLDSMREVETVQPLASPPTFGRTFHSTDRLTPGQGNYFPRRCGGLARPTVRRRFRPMWSTTSWAGQAGRRARSFYETLFGDLSESQVHCLRRLYGDRFVVDESVWRGKAPGKPFGLDGRGRPLEFRLLHVIEFAHSGDIKRENVWIDLAAIIRQLPQD